MGMATDENDARHGLTNFRHVLYEPSSWKRAALNLPLAILITATGIAASGCAKDEKPPVIQKHKIPDWAVEDENIELKVNTFDDKGVKEAYVQLNNELKIPLSKVSSRKENGEKAEWKGSYKIPAGNYGYTIVAEDKASNKSDPKGGEGKIIVYPFDVDNDGISYRDEVKYGLDPNKPDPVAKYILSKNSSFLIPALKFLDEGTVMDTNTKDIIDLIILYYPKIEENVPGSVDKFLNLVDVLPADKKYVVNKEYVNAAKDLFDFASDPRNKKQVELFLNTIKDWDKEDICAMGAYLELAKNPMILSYAKIHLKNEKIDPRLSGLLELLEYGGDLSKPINALSKILPLYCND